MNPRRFWRRAHSRSPFAANTAVTAATNLTLAVLGMMTGIVSARLLGPKGRGELAAIQNTPTFIGSLAMLGLPDALIYYTARDPGCAGRYLSTASLFALAASVPFMVGGYMAMPLFLHAQDVTVIETARWYLLIAPIYAMAGMLTHPLRGSGDFNAWNASRLMVPLLAVCVLAIAWSSEHATPRFVAFGYLLSCAIVFAPWFSLVRRRIPGPYKPDRQEIWPMLRYGLPCAMTGVPQTLNLRLDQMLMAALLPPRDLGIYAVAVAWSQAPTPLLSALGLVTTPMVASAGATAAGSQRFAATLRTTVVLALVLGAVFTLCSPFAIALLFGSSFAAAIPASLVLVPAAAVFGVNFVLQEGLRGLGHPYAVLKAEVGGVAVTAATLAVALRPMGIMGAALASLFGYATVCGILFASTRRLTCLPLSELVCPTLCEMQSYLAQVGAMARDFVGLAYMKGRGLPEQT